VPAQGWKNILLLIEFIDYPISLPDRQVARMVAAALSRGKRRSTRRNEQYSAENLTPPRSAAPDAGGLPANSADLPILDQAVNHGLIAPHRPRRKRLDLRGAVNCPN
jgi:hypothetical protein